MSDLFHRAKRVFGDVLDAPPAQRESLVERACAGDTALLGEVRSLLAAREHVTRFLVRESGAGRVVATLDAGRAGAPGVTESGTFVVATPADPPPTTGSVVAGRYELGERLGAGAFGAVYRAKDRLSQQDVAVKVLPLAGGAGFKMLRREVAILRRAKLPGIVEMIDDGIDGAHAFIAMKLVVGEPFPTGAAALAWETLAPRAIGLLDALARLHWLGVLHRDLKPENVLVSRSEASARGDVAERPKAPAPTDDAAREGNVRVGADARVVIVDLGIAWEGDGGALFTGGGYAAGTPAYLAPECLHGRPASIASDLYAVGVMLFEALSGRRLHPDAPLDEFIETRCAAAATSLAQAAPDVPAHVAAAVDTMLALDPAARPKSAAAACALLKGDDDWSPQLKLPRVGGTEALDRLVEAVKAAKSVDVGGARGTGRSRLLDDAEARLAADGYLVVRTKPAEWPFESLAPVLGPVPDRADWNADQVRAWARRRLTLALSDGFIVFADDAARSLDRASAEALAECRATGRVVRVVDGDAADVVLGPIAEVELRPLFRGPDRIHHLREDGAHELFRRTRGVAADVVRELTSWVEQGYARFEDGLVVVDRMGLDRLAARVLVMPPYDLALGIGLSPSAKELAITVALAGGPVDLAPLARAMGRSKWELDFDVHELTGRGVLRRVGVDAVTATKAIEDGGSIPARDARRRHRLIAESLVCDDERRLIHWTAAGEFEHAVSSAMEAAAMLLLSGLANRALAVCEDGLALSCRLAGAAEHQDVEDELLVLMLESSLAVGTTAALDGSLYCAGRRNSKSMKSQRVETLLRAARLAVVGDASRALDLIREPLDAADGRLERLRHMIRPLAARLVEGGITERESVRDVARWARRCKDREARGLLAESVGWLRYREANYGAAAARHSKRASLSQHPRIRLGAMLNAAAAALEVPNLALAESLAADARRLAELMRHQVNESRAEWLLRTVAYRRGDALEPDLQLVEAARDLANPARDGLIRLGEAAIAWRSGRLTLAARLAREAEDRAEAAGHRWQSLLARALLLKSGGAASSQVIASVEEGASVCPLPGIAIQVLGLAAHAHADAVASRSSVAERNLARIPESQLNHRREIISPWEAVEMMGLDIAQFRRTNLGAKS